MKLGSRNFQPATLDQPKTSDAHGQRDRYITHSLGTTQILYPRVGGSIAIDQHSSVAVGTPSFLRVRRKWLQPNKDPEIELNSTKRSKG